MTEEDQDNNLTAKKSRNDFIYWVRMGNRAHMAKILKFHKLDSW